MKKTKSSFFSDSYVFTDISKEQKRYIEKFSFSNESSLIFSIRKVSEESFVEFQKKFESYFVEFKFFEEKNKLVYVVNEIKNFENLFDLIKSHIELKSQEYIILKNKLYHFEDQDKKLSSLDLNTKESVDELQKASFFSPDLKLQFDATTKLLEEREKQDKDYKNRNCGAEARRESRWR